MDEESKGMFAEARPFIVGLIAVALRLRDGQSINFPRIASPAVLYFDEADEYVREFERRYMSEFHDFEPKQAPGTIADRPCTRCGLPDRHPVHNHGKAW